MGFGRGFDEVIWVRGQGYDPLVPAGDPRAGRSGSRTSRACGFPPRTIPNRDLWKARWEQFLRNRAVLADRRRGEHRGRADRQGGDRLARAARAAESDPFLLWLDLFSPHGPWDPPQPYRDQYATVEPDEFEAGEEGDLVEEAREDDDEIDIEEVPVLIDVPAGAVGDVLERGRAVPAAADLRRDRHAGRPLAGRALRGLATDGPDGRHAADLHQRPGRAAGRARLSSAGSGPGSTRS